MKITLLFDHYFSFAPLPQKPFRILTMLVSITYYVNIKSQQNSNIIAIIMFYLLKCANLKTIGQLATKGTNPKKP